MNQEDWLLDILCNKKCALTSLSVNSNSKLSFVLIQNTSDPEAKVLILRYFFSHH